MAASFLAAFVRLLEVLAFGDVVDLASVTIPSFFFLGAGVDDSIFAASGVWVSGVVDGAAASLAAAGFFAPLDAFGDAFFAAGFFATDFVAAPFAFLGAGAGTGTGTGAGAAQPRQPV
ncbi:hypothetical protein ACFSUK_32175 [Sphingobium scionense]